VKREAISLLERMVQVGGADVLARRNFYLFFFFNLERMGQVVRGGDELEHRCLCNVGQKRPDIASKET
jgi:hypothetical protein